PNDVWTVGLYSPDMATYATLTEHWNGTQWSLVPSPNVGSLENYLYSVAAVAANDVWAVGYSSNYGSPQRTLIEHWNGTQWSVVPSPNVGSNRNYLRWVAQVGPNDVWAVGTYWNAASVQQTLTLHWDGRAWSVVPSPNNGTHENYLNGVTVAAS